MVIVYVLQSVKDGILYVGMTEDLQRRLHEHNAGKSKFTSGHAPWQLVYQEEQTSFKEARQREKYLKSAAGKRFIHKILNSCKPPSLFQGGDTGSLPD